MNLIRKHFIEVVEQGSVGSKGNGNLFHLERIAVLFVLFVRIAVNSRIVSKAVTGGHIGQIGWGVLLFIFRQEGRRGSG
jgi:hypothetical protein